MTTESGLAYRLRAAILISLCMPGFAWAQVAPQVPSGTSSPSIERAGSGDEGSGFEFGGHFQPVLDVRGEWTDNFYYQPDGGEEVWGALIRPTLRYANELPRFRFAAEAAGDFALYDSPSSEDNYEDAAFSAGLAWLPAARHGFAFGMKHLLEHDPFGTVRTEGVPASLDRSLDEWSSTIIDLKYRYGGVGSKIHIESGIVGRTKDYRSNRDGANGTTPTRYFDYDNVAGDVTALYYFSPKTAFLVQGVVGHTAFQTPFVDPINGTEFDSSNDEQRYLAGVRWRAAAKTTADLRIGYFQREFDDPKYRDFDAIDWSGQVTWTPSATDAVALMTGRGSQESYRAQTSFINNSQYGVDWTHNWNRRFFHRLTATYLESDFEGVGPFRTDDYWTATLYGQYQATRWLALLGGYTYQDRDSNETAVIFEKNSAYLGLRIEP